jgi:hypothetical protein
MKKIIIGTILTIAAAWIINLVIVNNDNKDNKPAQAAVTAKAGEVPEETILEESLAAKATSTATTDTKPISEKTAGVTATQTTKTTTTKTPVSTEKEKTTPEKATPVKTAITKTTTTKTTTAKNSTTKTTTMSGMPWDASAVKMVSSMVQFDYSKTIRQAYINKVNTYAKRNGIKTVTSAVINGMHE